jgi:polyhydroxybutyrate depolymerase
MIKTKMVVVLFILLSIALVLKTGHTQTLRDKIRERIRERIGDYNFSLVHSGLTRKYNVHLPQNYDKSVPLPVVIYIHGGGGSMKAANQDGIDKASDKFGFILVTPAGTGLIPNKLLTWNSGKWDTDECCGQAYKNNVDDVGFLSRMIDELGEKFNIDKNRIFATGISNGAMMSYRLACELSDKIAAVAVVAPPAVPERCIPLRPIAVMQINGTADSAVPISGGKGGGIIGKSLEVQASQDMVNSWLKRNDCAVTSTTTYQKGKATCITYSPCKDGVAVEFCKVEDMGHTWPSGHQYMSAAKVGQVSYDISFDQIWEFFKKHPKP